MWNTGFNIGFQQMRPSSDYSNNSVKYILRSVLNNQNHMPN